MKPNCPRTWFLKYTHALLSESSKPKLRLMSFPSPLGQSNSQLACITITSSYLYITTTSVYLISQLLQSTLYHNYFSLPYITTTSVYIISQLPHNTTTSVYLISQLLQSTLYQNYLRRHLISQLLQSTLYHNYFSLPYITTTSVYLITQLLKSTL